MDLYWDCLRQIQTGIRVQKVTAVPENQAIRPTCPTLPELAYGVETVQRMRNMQRKMERSMLGISLI